MCTAALSSSTVGWRKQSRAALAMAERRLRHLEGMIVLRVRGGMRVGDTTPVVLSIHRPTLEDIPAMEREKDGQA